MRTAVCMNVRNEARDIGEWMAFHRIAGFDTQIIFDNDSSDATRRLIQSAGRLFDVHYHHWGQADHRYQIDAYFTACHLYRHAFDWIAFIDSDEFLVTTSPQPISAFLARFDTCGGVGVNWAIYGANGHEHHPPGLLTEAFTRRSEAGFFPNRHIKSIVRPLAVQACENPHWFHLDAPYVTADGAPLTWLLTPEGHLLRGLTQDAPDYAACRVNHYFTRSHAQWAEKVRRGYPADIAVRKMEEFGYYDRNEVEDPIAARWSGQVRTLAAQIRDAAAP